MHIYKRYMYQLSNECICMIFIYMDMSFKQEIIKTRGSLTSSLNWEQ